MNDITAPEPVHVHLASTSIELPGPASQRPCKVSDVPRTIVLTASRPYALLAAEIDARSYVMIQAIDHPVVICESVAQAQAAANTDATLAAPEGAIVPVGVVVPLQGTGALYVAASQFPARVSAIAGYRQQQ